jgi:hypothetical protein
MLINAPATISSVPTISEGSCRSAPRGPNAADPDVRGMLRRHHAYAGFMAVPEWLKRLWPLYAYRRAQGWPQITPPTVEPKEPPPFDAHQGKATPDPPAVR